MTLPASPSHIEYIGDGTSLTFTYPFKIDDVDELEVRRDGQVDTNTVNYSVSGVGSDSGGEITYFIAPASGVVVSLRRFVLYEQLLSIIPNGALPAQAIEHRFDQLVKMIQQLDEELSRKVGFGVGAKSTLRDLVMPSPGGGQVIGYNSPGTALRLYKPTTFTVTPDPTSGVTSGYSVAEVDAVPGEYELTAIGLAPADSEIKGVLYYCAIAFDPANGLSSVDIGGLDVEDGWGHEIGITMGTTATRGDFRRGDHPIATGAGDIIIKANGGPFAATGRAILTVYWETLTARTSV